MYSCFPRLPHPGLSSRAPLASSGPTHSSTDRPSSVNPGHPPRAQEQVQVPPEGLVCVLPETASSCELGLSCLNGLFPQGGWAVKDIKATVFCPNI